MTVTPTEARPGPVRRPARRTLRSDLSRLWHERRGLSITVVAVGILILLGVTGALTGEDDQPTLVRVGSTTSALRPAAPVDTVPPTGVQPAPSTTSPATTTTTTALPTTVATTRAPSTTAAAATTNPPATSPPKNSVTATTAVSYANCAAARAAGAAPISRGQPGYRPGLDADNDGIACES